MLDQARTKLAHTRHRLRHEALRLPLSLVQRGARRLAGQARLDSRAVIAELDRRFAALVAEDFANVQGGLYPESLLSQMPLRKYSKQLPALAWELGSILRRMQNGDPNHLPAGAHPEDYPEYYRRTYHWQTDGYLSDRSAQLYEVGVEFLFGGTADLMRRQVIAPMSRFVRGEGIEKPRVLDVACGTGPTLRQLREAMPQAALTGVDLSPYYIEEAKRQLRGADVNLTVGDARNMNFEDGAFDIVTSTYLFHEMPRDARTATFAEMKRVLRPGGLLVVQDSIQRIDSPELLESIDNFGADFHEPFYDDYTHDPLEARLEQLHLSDIRSATHMVSKTVWGRSV